MSHRLKLKRKLIDISQILTSSLISSNFVPSEELIANTLLFKIKTFISEIILIK